MTPLRPYLLFLCLFLSGTGTLLAQTDQTEKLANQYYSQGEFAKALPLYQQLFDKNGSNRAYYQGTYQCYLALQQYDNALKLVKKQSKKNPDDPAYYCDWGNIYLLQQDKKSADSKFGEALKHLGSDPATLNHLAAVFAQLQQPDYAIEVYKAGNKQLPGNYDFQLAELYRQQGAVDDAIDCYLHILKLNGGEESAVQNVLQPLLPDKKFADALQSRLLKTLQDEPDNNVLYDLLIWYYIQEKNFDMAFLQVKALDKKNKEEGNRLFMFAESAEQEGYYDAAINAYNYIITEKGKTSALFQPARTRLINVMKTKIMVGGHYTDADLRALKKNYEDYFLEFGENGNNLFVVRDYANLEARYLFDLDSAIHLLQDAVLLPSGDRKMSKGWLKLDLGDYLLMKGEVWDATLLYSQVDKDFEEEPMGEEARFRNAKLSYYTCDFDFAKGMLDVLKGATTELISNDAINLSVFLLDNTGLDTTTDAMCLYSRAQLLEYQNRHEEALHTLDSLATRFPGSSLNDDVVFEKAMIYLDAHDYEKAAGYFLQVDSAYSYDLLADDALFHVAQLYEEQLHNPAKALDLYKKILLNYKGSVFSIEARKRFNRLRGNQVN